MTYAIALAICMAAAVLKGLCAGRDPMGRLRRLKQPAWSPPAWAWVLIGLGWYAICFTALVRLLPAWPQTAAPVILVCVLLLANAGANVPLFRMRRLDIAFWWLLPYWAALGALLLTACPHDRVVCALFGAYVGYQLYAAAWQYRLWKLNGARHIA